MECFELVISCGIASEMTPIWFPMSVLTLFWLLMIIVSFCWIPWGCRFCDICGLLSLLWPSCRVEIFVLSTQKYTCVEDSGFFLPRRGNPRFIGGALDRVDGYMFAGLLAHFLGENVSRISVNWL